MSRLMKLRLLALMAIIVLRNKREFESTKQQLCDAGVAVISE